jgi:hypothetical protein
MACAILFFVAGQAGFPAFIGACVCALRRLAPRFGDRQVRCAPFSRILVNTVVGSRCAMTGYTVGRFMRYCLPGNTL